MSHYQRVIIRKNCEENMLKGWEKVWIKLIFSDR